MPVGIHDSRVTCTPETQKPQKVKPETFTLLQNFRTPEAEFHCASSDTRPRASLLGEVQCSGRAKASRVQGNLRQTAQFDYSVRHSAPEMTVSGDSSSDESSVELVLSPLQALRQQGLNR